MSDDRRPVTVRRRELLAAAGAIGSVSAVGAIGSVARLADAETFAGSVFAAGALDLEIACDSATCGVADDGTVQFGFPDLQPGDEGSERLTLTQRGNPGWLWLASTCPGEGLEDAITVNLGYDPGCTGTPDVVASGSLASVLADLARSVRLGDACLDGDGTACLTLDWAFPATPDVAQYEGASLDFELQVASVQCRHTDGTVSPLPVRECTQTTTTTTTTDPNDYHAISNMEVWAVVDGDCVRLGKLETGGNNHLDVGVIDLPDWDGHPTNYDLDITETVDKPGGVETVGVAFELLTDDGSPGPELCKVVVKSGRDPVTYDATDLAPASNGTHEVLYGGMT